MQEIDRQRPLVALTIAVVRANPGPFAIAVALAIAASLVGITDFAPDDPAITWMAVLGALLRVAAATLAMLFAAWAVCTGGHMPGLAGVIAIPTERLRRFAVYGVIFGLWLLVFTVLAAKAAGGVLVAETGLAKALLVGAVVAVVTVLIYVQLGLAFADILHSGEGGILVAMVLGIASARRLIARLAIPAVLVSLPHVVLSSLILDDATMLDLSTSFPAIPALDIVAISALAAVEAFGAVMYGLAVTQVYFEILPAARQNHGTWFQN